MEIENPWIILADAIRHVAKAKDVDDADVLRWVLKELDNPTTELTGGRPN